MKSMLMRKAAEAKSALVSKEAANNSTEVVILILFVVLIVIAVATAIKALLTADGTGLIDQAEGKVSDAVGTLG